jgi:hypothetical protein
MAVFARIEALCKLLVAKQDEHDARLRRIDDSVAYLRAKVNGVLPDGPTKPTFPPIDKPRDPWPPVNNTIVLNPPQVEPLPTPVLPPSDGGPTDSKEFDPKQNGRHHKVKLFSGIPVQYTLPAGNYSKVEFQAVSRPTPEYAIQGERPMIEYRVSDALGERGRQTVGINGGAFEVSGPFAGNVILTLTTTDHIGHFIVQCNAR